MTAGVTVTARVGVALRLLMRWFRLFFKSLNGVVAREVPVANGGATGSGPSQALQSSRALSTTDLEPQAAEPGLGPTKHQARHQEAEGVTRT